MPEMAMYSHVRENSDFEERPLEDCLKLVAEGKAYECDICDYDDGSRTFHCSDPCPVCDGATGGVRVIEREAIFDGEEAYHG